MHSFVHTYRLGEYTIRSNTLMLLLRKLGTWEANSWSIICIHIAYYKTQQIDSILYGYDKYCANNGRVSKNQYYCIHSFNAHTWLELIPNKR